VNDPVLRRTLAAAGLPATGRFTTGAGWVSRVWVGDEHVVRTSEGRFRDAYRHEAAVLDLLAGSEVPHARILAHGEGPDGPWCVSERLPGQTLHAVWPEADPGERRSIVESLGAALRALHRVPVSTEVRPPWLLDALNGDPWQAFHPPVVGAALQEVEAARCVPGHDPDLFDDVEAWVQERLALFTGDRHVLVHGDVHGSNVLVDDGRVTGVIDFPEALTQLADVELDTLLRWCARAREFPPTPTACGLDPADLAEVPGWLHDSYPDLFAGEHLDDRLLFHDVFGNLALCAHHPEPHERERAWGRLADALSGRSHLDRLTW